MLARPSLTRLLSSGADMGEAALSLPNACSVAEAYRAHPGMRLVHAASALALENGLAVVTHDRGFARFTALRRIDPVTGESSPA